MKMLLKVCRHYLQMCVIGLSVTFSTCQGQAPAVLKILTNSEQSSIDNKIMKINFSDGNVTSLYDCLCKNTSRTCSIKYYPIAGMSDLTVHDTTTTQVVSSNAGFTDYFKCANNDLYAKVTCDRLYLNEIDPCSTSTLNKIEVKRGVSILQCGKGCTGIIWKSIRESLEHTEVINRQEKNCGRKCERGNVPSSSGHSTHTLLTVKTESSTTPAVVNTATDTHSRLESNTTPVIIGVVVSSLFLVLIAVILFIVWRRMKQRSASPKQSHINPTPSISQTFTEERISAMDGVDRCCEPKFSNRCCEPTSSNVNTQNIGMSEVTEYTNIDHENANNKAAVHVPSTTSSTKGYIDNNTNNNVPDNGYSVIDPAKCNRQDVYNKLGETPKNINYPYDVLHDDKKKG